MALPRAEELSRWTVQQVTNWLQQMSLTNFREPFLLGGIDGSKLMKMHPSEVDSKYPGVPIKKRNILKDILSRIENTAPQVAQWNTAPMLPPRRAPPPPVAPPDDSGSSDGDDWGSEFGSDDEAADDYIEPTSQPKLAPNSNQRHVKPVPAPRLPATHPDEPQEVYEVVEDNTPEVSHGGGLSRKGTIIDKLKSALHHRQHEAADDEVAPPPRPPRRLPAEPSSQPKTTDRHGPLPAPPVQQGHGHRPPPPLPHDEPKPPEDVYEVVAGEDDSQGDTANGDDDYMQPDPAKVETPNKYLDFADTSRAKPADDRPGKRERHPLPPVGSRDASPPPRPGHHKKGHSATPPQAGGWLFNSEQAQESLGEGDLNRYPWFHGKIGRNQANQILEGYRSDGMFLIRESERSPNQPFTLALWYGERSWNLPIRCRADKRYAAGTEKPNETSFGTINELVEYYKQTTLALKGRAGPQLQQPAPRC